MTMNKDLVPALVIYIMPPYIVAGRWTAMVNYASIFRVLYIPHYRKLTSHKTLRCLSNIILHFGNKLEFINFLVIQFPFTQPTHTKIQHVKDICLVHLCGTLQLLKKTVPYLAREKIRFRMQYIKRSLRKEPEGLKVACKANGRIVTDCWELKGGL